MIIKRIIRLYIKAIDNALFLDNWNNWNHVYPKGRRISFFSSVLPVAYPFFALLFLLKSVAHLLKVRRVSLNCENYFLGTSIAIKRSVIRAKLQNKEAKWLPIPFSKIPDVELSKQIDPFSVISFYDVIISFISTIGIYYYLLFHYGHRVAVKSLDSYKWSLFYCIGNKLKKESNVYFCNHKDVWAVLIDNFPIKGKYLIQHGTEMLKHNKYNIQPPSCLYCAEYNFWVENMPIKLKNIVKVYAFSEIEAKALQMAILSCNPIIETTGYGLELTMMKKNSAAKAVLIIGYIEKFYNEEEKVLNALESLNVEVFLKNHPAIPPEKYEYFRNKYHFSFINSPLFPSVDLVISYDSTLAHQYESMGICVLYYDDLLKTDVNNHLKTLLNV